MMITFLVISSAMVWVVVLLLGFLLLGALRNLALLGWRLEQLETTTPKRLGRHGLKRGQKAPDFTLPSLAGPEISLHEFAGRKVLLVFMQPGCGPCHGITPELNRLQDAGDVQILVVQNGDLESVRIWADERRPHFPVAVQERLSLSKRFEVFTTPFAFLIDERGMITSRGIARTKQYLSYILTRAGREGDGGLGEDPASGPEGGPPPASLASLPSSSSKEVYHV